MKAKREHRVPLCRRAVEVLDAARPLGDRGGPLAFTNGDGEPLDEKVFRRLLERLRVPTVPHGFRSSFRDWAAEETEHRREVIEAAPTHVVGNKVEAAYARSDLFEQQRRLMNDWAVYLDNQHGSDNPPAPLTLFREGCGSGHSGLRMFGAGGEEGPRHTERSPPCLGARSRRIRRRGPSHVVQSPSKMRTVMSMRGNAVTVGCPSQLTEAETSECVALIAEGDAVDPDAAERWFPLSTVVAVKRSGADIIGVGVIKPARDYTETMARRSRAELHPETHELGYIVVKKEHRRQGISRVIVQALLSAHDAPLFATTSDEWMKHTLERFRFVRRGIEWPSTRGGNMLSLWVRANE